MPSLFPPPPSYSSTSTGAPSHGGTSSLCWSSTRAWSCTTALCSAPWTAPMHRRSCSSPTSSPPPSPPWRPPSPRRASPAATCWVSVALLLEAWLRLGHMDIFNEEWDVVKFIHSFIVKIIDTKTRAHERACKPIWTFAYLHSVCSWPAVRSHLVPPQDVPGPSKARDRD